MNSVMLCFLRVLLFIIVIFVSLTKNDNGSHDQNGHRIEHTNNNTIDSNNNDDNDNNSNKTCFDTTTRDLTNLLADRQRDYQHLIIDLNPDHFLDALDKFTQDCASWSKVGDDTKPVYKYDGFRRKLSQLYEEYGVLLIRGILQEDLLEQLIKAGDYIVYHPSEEETTARTFNAIQFGPLFSAPSVNILSRDDVATENDAASLSSSSSSTTKEENDLILSTFRTVALTSPVPSLIALLLDLDSRLVESSFSNGGSSELRVLNDVFLAKSSSDKQVCGWHIDDATFWPSDPHHKPTGINAWIAMDDILAINGGGMAVIPKSHRTSEYPWILEAQRAIGHTLWHPSEGFHTVDKLFQTLHTCSLADVAPEINTQTELMGILFDIQKGDVLLMNRFLWHRSVHVNQNSVHQGCHNNDEQQQKYSNERFLKRYTIRYEVGDTPLLKGISFHPSTLYDPSNAGKTLHDMCHRSGGGPFFPKCWPFVDRNEISINALEDLIHHKFMKANQIKEEMIHNFTQTMT